LFGVNKKHYKLIPILVATEAVLENALMVHGIYGGIFASRIVFYVLLLVPVFVNKKTKPKKGSLEWNIRNMTAKTAVMLVAFIIIHIPFSLFIFEIPYVSSLFWAAFTLAYQIPGLLYCKKRLLEKPALFEKTGISSLTKRENEVALAICKGDKYEEIARKLFISLSAVKKHSYNIYRKLGINNNRELMHLFMESEKENDVTI
jgi:DNA-binding CsgD family transcriptional regulator